MIHFKFSRKLIREAFQVLDTFSEEEIIILLNLCLNLQQISDSSSNWKTILDNYRAEDFRIFMVRMKNDGVFIPVSHWGYVMHFAPHYLIALLIKTRNIPDSDIKYADVETYQIRSCYNLLTRSIRQFLCKGTTVGNAELNSCLNDEMCCDILSVIPFFNELSGFDRNLPPLLQKRIISYRLVHSSELSLPFDKEITLCNYLNNTQFTSLQKRDIFNMALIHTTVYSLNESYLKTILSDECPSYYFAEAFFTQLHGKMAEAIKLYEQGIKRMPLYDKKLPLPSHPFYRCCYALALFSEKSNKSISKLQKLFAKREVHEDPDNYPVLLIALISGNREISNDIIQKGADTDLYSKLIRILSALILENFKIWQSPWPDYMELIQEMLVPEQLLLWKECVRIFPFIQNAPNLSEEQQSLGPLVPVFVKKEPWEIILSDILSKEKTNLENEESTSKERIVYMINNKYRYSEIEIVPMLQKKKTNGSWTNGRRITLDSLYYNSLYSMTDLDKRVAKTIERINGYRGGYLYNFRTNKTMAELAGQPVVFTEESPHYPVEIIKERPFLSISRNNEGFHLDSNVGDLSSGALTQVIEESNLRYRVIELSLRQFNYLKDLLKLGQCPPEAEPMLKKCLETLSKDLIIHSELILPDERFAKRESDSRPVVQFTTWGEQYKVELFVKPLGFASSYCKPGEGQHVLMGTIEGKKMETVRDFELERNQADAVIALFQEIDSDANDVIIITEMEKCLSLLESLHLMGDQVIVEWPEGVKFEVRQQIGMNRFSITTRAHNNWFELDGELQVNEKTTLKIKDIIDQIEKKSTRFIQLDGIGFIALTAQLRNHLFEIQQIARKEKEKLLISTWAAPALIGIEKDGGKVTKDNAFNKLLQHIEKSGKTCFEIPDTLQGSLRDYQEEGYQWLCRLADWEAGACLADDMGLGKTIQTIALLLHRATQGPALVITPASVISNWEQELMRFAPALSVKVLNRNASERCPIIKGAAPFDVVLLSYGLLITECENLNQKEWNTIVLDEAHTIKNRDTKMSKAAMQLKGYFRVILTGTPVQNHLNEIWNLFQFINPGLLNSFEQFNDRFIIPIEVRQEKSKQRFLKKLLSPFILRRTKNDVLNELPGKTDIIQPVELSDDEMTYYEALRREAEMTLEKGDLNAIQTLAEITKLRQAACHPALVNPSYKGSSSKTEEFIKLAEQLINNHHRALVFSQFTSHLALIRKALDEIRIPYLYLDGATPINKRSQLVYEFQTGSCPLFLISLKAGGLGLNLTGADYIFHLDPWWNPAIEEQASDRAYRIGQTRPVTVYRLISKHTIEEKIIELHHTKKALADSLLEGTNLNKTLSKEDFLALLRNF